MTKQELWPAKQDSDQQYGCDLPERDEPGGLRRTGSTSCKHGNSPCGICGTTTHRDMTHTTIRGKGKVGSIHR
jgi:hypothetical protein